MSLPRVLLVTAVALVAAPASAEAASLMVAYDRYVTGKGFEIGLKNAQTGADIPLPAGVNTNADELHPTLSHDGRILAFTRMTLQPKLNGDIVPPPDRRIIWVDRQTGVVTTTNLAGVGPVLTSRTGPTDSLTFGITPEADPIGTPTNFNNFEGNVQIARTLAHATTPPSGTNVRVIRGNVSSQRLDVPHAASVPDRFTRDTFGGSCQPCTVPVAARYLQLSYHDPNTGLLEKSTARLSGFGFEAGLAQHDIPVNILEFGAPDQPTGHPVPRAGDGYVALDQTTSGDADIKTIGYPTESALSAAPAPITTTASETMPAWSPDGIQLGFVRTATGQRRLHVFDATPGIQSIVGTPVDLGSEAPTPQTRQFQSVYGGMALGPLPPSSGGGPTITCGSRCRSQLGTPTLNQITLTPRAVSTRSGQSIGIFVVRVNGTRRLLGRRVARITPVGRVPLGALDRGTNRFRWNGEVNGRKLRAGTYLLTYRALRGRRVIALSDSVRFTVARDGSIGKVRRER